MGEQIGFWLDLDRCVGCHACEVACQAHMAVDPGLRPRRVAEIWAGSYPDLVARTVSYACMHCAEPDCVDSCPTGAIVKRAQDGIVVIDAGACIACLACGDACSYGAIEFDRAGIAVKCDLCVDRLDAGRLPVCVDTCPTEALRFGPLGELAALPSTRVLEGAGDPSMLVSSGRWAEIESLLPWRQGSPATARRV
jgi:anaerobic dimethyl sulfoxide reductase subunit B